MKFIEFDTRNDTQVVTYLSTSQIRGQKRELPFVTLVAVGQRHIVLQDSLV